MARSHRLRPRQTTAALRSQETGMEEFTAPSRPGPRPVGCLLLEHAVPSLVSETPVHPLAQGLVGWGPPREDSRDLPLTSLSA